MAVPVDSGAAAFLLGGNRSDRSDRTHRTDTEVVEGEAGVFERRGFEVRSA